MARRCKTLAVVLFTALTISVAAVIASAQTSSDVFKINYFSNNVSAAPDATVRIINPGLTYGNLCAMVYVFDYDQQLAECCGCAESPDGLHTLSVKQNLTSNPLTGRIPADGIIKMVAAVGKGSTCDPAASLQTKANLRAWATHVGNPVGKVYPITETESSDSVLSTTELTNLRAQCSFIELLGSGSGICSCTKVPPPDPCVSKVVSFTVTVTPNPLSLTVGQTGQLLASLTYSDGSTPVITWRSSDNTIATVSSSGLVTGVKKGNATISASAPENPSRPDCPPIIVSITVTVDDSTPPSCTTGNSMATLIQGKNVIAYVPNGSWTTYTPGIQVVPVEPTPLVNPTSIVTPAVVNACAANSATGKTVCTANSTDVYLISGSDLTATLTSNATGGASFSGGYCANCGVVINQETNTALITMGNSSAPSGSGFQFLDLKTNTFSAPVPAVHAVSEDIVWDPFRNLILSPNEKGTFDLFDTSKTTVAEYGRTLGGTLDSAGEECATGIGLATEEYSSNLLITDLTQLKMSSGSPTGTWTAPYSILHIPDFDPYDATESGISGIAVAEGSHLGIVTGEFPNPPGAGNAILVFQLPSTSGSGTPALVDWAVATLPLDPLGSPFSIGCDPHAVAAYVSPNTGRAMGLVTDYSWTSCLYGGTPQYLGVIDLKAILKAPRIPGTHTVSPLFSLTSNDVVEFVSVQ